MSKELALESIKARILTLKPPPIGWKYNGRTPFNNVDQAKCPAFYMFDFQEEVIYNAPRKGNLQRYRVSLLIEIWIANYVDSNASKNLNEMLASLRGVLEGFAPEGEVLAMTEKLTRFKIESLTQRTASMQSFWTFTYYG